jgi:hypothetical protein
MIDRRLDDLGRYGPKPRGRVSDLVHHRSLGTKGFYSFGART